MRRRSLIISLLGLAGLAPVAARAKSTTVDHSLAAAPAHRCLECGSHALRPGPINQDVWICDSCGAVISSMDLIQAGDGEPYYWRIVTYEPLEPQRHLEPTRILVRSPPRE